MFKKMKRTMLLNIARKAFNSPTPSAGDYDIVLSYLDELNMQEVMDFVKIISTSLKHNLYSSEFVEKALNLLVAFSKSGHQAAYQTLIDYFSSCILDTPDIPEKSVLAPGISTRMIASIIRVLDSVEYKPDSDKKKIWYAIIKGSPSYIQGIKTPPEEVFLIAMYVLTDMVYQIGALEVIGFIAKPSFVPQLIEVYYSRKPVGAFVFDVLMDSAKSQFFLTLGRIGGKDALEFLASVWKSISTDYYGDISKALVTTKDPAALEPLLDMYCRKPSFAIEDLIVGFGEYASEGLIKRFLREAMANNSVSGDLARMLKKLNDKIIIDISDPSRISTLARIMRIKTTGKIADCECAAFLLERIGAPAVAVMIETLNDDYYYVRGGVALVLGKLKDPNAALPLLHSYIRKEGKQLEWSHQQPIYLESDKARFEILWALNEIPWDADIIERLFHKFISLIDDPDLAAPSVLEKALKNHADRISSDSLRLLLLAKDEITILGEIGVDNAFGPSFKKEKYDIVSLKELAKAELERRISVR